MSLSGDIRAGSLVSKQVAGFLILLDGEEIYACAAGAALLVKEQYYPITKKSANAIANLYHGDAKSVIYQYYPDLLGVTVNIPCDCDSYGPVKLALVVEHLNDVCRWSRERIAGWLESLGY